MYAAFAGTNWRNVQHRFLRAENRSGLNQKAAICHAYCFCQEKHNALYQKQEAAARKWFEEHGKKYQRECLARKLPDEGEAAAPCGSES